MHRIFTKKVFLFTMGKAFHNWVEKFSQGRSKVADNARLGAEVTETVIKRFLCCGFRSTGKAKGQAYQCWWRICREITVFFFRFYIHLLTLPRMYIFLFGGVGLNPH
jgi:hypothetical protein